MLKYFRWTAWILMSAALASIVGAAAPRNLPKAIEAQLELQRQRPDDAKVANDLGNLLLLAGRGEEAEAAYQHSIELAPDDATPRYNLGLLRQRQGRSKEALESFRAVVKLNPSNAWAHYQVGALEEAQGERERAILAYGKDFTLNPELASSDVNPQVIESKLVIEALLRGYREAAKAPLAPQAYDDPNRIALLMISSPEGEAESADEEKMAEGEMEDPSSRGGTLPAQADEEESGSRAGNAAPASRGQSGRSGARSSETSARRVLTPDSIDRGSTLGEVGPPASSSRSSRDRGFSTTRTRRSTITANPNTYPPIGSRTRSGRVRYRPSIRSTGNLGLDVLPPSENGGVPID